jgi:diguanylate cyclase (GGDEF)-like protein
MHALEMTIRSADEAGLHKDRLLEDLRKSVGRHSKTIKAGAIALRAVNTLAFNDVLTGLPNRRLLDDRLKQAIASNKRCGSYSCAIFLDLDKFKRINDQFGHEAGDQLLISIGGRIKILVRDTDTVARYGGDEFVILLNKLSGSLLEAKSSAEQVANKILESFNLPHILHIHNATGEKLDIAYQIAASLGIVMFNGDVSKEVKILEWADEAMYKAKSEGGSAICFYKAVKPDDQLLDGPSILVI